MATGKTKIVIVGGGFGGVKIAKLFARENVDVTLIDRHNFHLFQPLLYQVSTAVLSTDEIAYPLRSFFRGAKNVNLYMAKARGVDQERNVVITNHGEIPYDYLILAAGATTNFFGMKEVEEHSFGMKTIQEALHIRDHVLHEFERASKPYRTPEDRKKRMTFVVVGGGPTGVEEAGALTELIALQKQEIHNLDFNDVSVKLIEATGKLLPMMPENLQKKTVEVLQKKGVEVMLNTQVVGYDGDVLRLKNGVEIPTTTVIWAAGVRAVDFIANCGGEYARDGRIWVDEDLMIKGAVNKNVFAIGDCAGFMHGDMQRPLPTVAPVATQQAQVAYENIMALMKGASKDSLKKFVYKDLGAMATIGRGEAVVGSGLPSILKPFFSTGFLAWCSWLFIHLLRLAGAHANFTVAVKWAWNFLFGTRLGRIITNISLTDDMTQEELKELKKKTSHTGA